MTTRRTSSASRQAAKTPTRSTKPPAPKPKATAAPNPTQSRLAARGIAAPAAPPMPEGSRSAVDTVDARLVNGEENPFAVPVIPGATDDDLDIEMIRQQEEERLQRRLEAEARNRETFERTSPDPTVDFDAPMAMPDLSGYALFECPGSPFLEITVGKDHDIKFRNYRCRTKDPIEIDALRSKKLRQRHGIFEATVDGIGSELFWSADGTFWHSDAARLEHDRIHRPGVKAGRLSNPWPA